MLLARSGQTLLEGLIAIFVVTVGLMAVIGLAISNNTNAQINNDRTIATSLAREGLEVAKHVRDSNWLAGAPFSQGLLVGSTAVPQSNFDNNPLAWSLAFGAYGNLTNENTLVWWIDTGGRQHFNQPNGTNPTKFHRNLTFSALCQVTDARGTSFAYSDSGTNACASGEILIGARVLSTVQWQQALGYRSVILELRLFDWR